MDHANTEFTREKLADAINIWNRSAITLLDIRHNLISREQSPVNYRLPASAFLYTRGEKAEVRFDNTFYNMERFGVFHSHRQSELTITPQCKWLEYYIVLYKAGEPAFHKSEYARLLARTNPFRQQYGFLPSNPLFFAEHLRRMYNKWKGPTQLNLFYGKTAFYQLVYEVYEEIEQGGIQVLEPDIIAVAKRYLDEHYQDAISIQELCDSLGISHSHFHRSFKQQTGSAPQEFLIKTRISAAMELLRQNDTSIREVAIHCGFPDEINFYRQFVKHIGVAPSVYKQNLQRDMRDYAMENSQSFPYNWESEVSLDELKGKGANYMFKQMRSKAVVAAALSLMLMLSACGTTATNAGKADSSPTATISQGVEAKATEPVEEGTRIVSTSLGDVEVPINPKRVACYFWAGDLLAIGITPIASDLVDLGSLKELLKDAEYWGAWDDSSQEALMAMEPDLIVVSTEEEYETFYKIAPCIVVPYETPVDERMKLWGEIFEKEYEAQAALSAFNHKVEKYKQDFQESGIYGKTIALSAFRNNTGSLWLCGDGFGYGAELLYQMLGFEIPDIIKSELIDTDEQIRELSWEVVPEFLEAVDYLQVTSYDGRDINKLNENAIWNAIPAVKSGNIITYSADYESNSLLVMDKALDAYYEQFMALEGN